MLKKLLITIVFLGNTLLFGKTGVVKGKVFDSGDKEELPFACVQLEQQGKAISKAVTDITGAFIFEGVPVGVYDLKVAFLGYCTASLPGVIVCADKLTQESVELEPVAIMLNTVFICEYVEPIIDGCCCCRGCCFRTECYFGCSCTTCRSLSVESDSIMEEKVKSEEPIVCQDILTLLWILQHWKLLPVSILLQARFVCLIFRERK